MKYIIDNQEVKLDYNINLYDPVIQAYLEKRWTKKNEIESKIYSIQPLKSIEDSLKMQKLVNLSNLLNNERLLSLSKSDFIDSKYIMSVCCEQHFKPMLDQYLQKVLLNGQTVPMNEYQKYMFIKKKVLALYRVFFYGDSITLYERKIEKRYLAQKQQKWYRFLSNQKLLINKCVWTYNQQKCLEGMRNWRSKNLSLYDDFRPLFDKMPEIQKKINKNQSFLERLFSKNKEELQYIATVLFTRVIAYCSSTEFISNLSIPPDFYIEINILNFHMALIITRLKCLNCKDSSVLIIYLEKEFEKFLQNKSIKFKIKNTVLNNNQTIEYLKLSRNISIEFALSSLIKNENGDQIFKILEKIVFLEKAEIKKENIKLFSAYVKANFRNLNTLDFAEIISGFEWDIYKISFEDLEKESLNNSLELDFIDSKLIKLSKQFENSKSKCFNWFYLTLFKNMRKFRTLGTYDYFNEREEIEKNQGKKYQKYFWKTKEN